MKIADRTFIVSGGSSGLGLATAHNLLNEPNAYISIIDRSPAPAELLSNPHVKYFQTDITKVDQIERAVEETVNWTKETHARLGGVVNCAGVGVASKIIDANNQPHDLDLWDFVLAVNLTGSFNLTRLALKHLIHVPPEDGEDGERGVVILVSSAAAFEGQQGQVAYSASKGALRSMTLPLAGDLSRHAIRVVTIAPGIFDSPMVANMSERVRRVAKASTVYPRRLGRGEEFAKTVRWILECPYINGECIRVSAGGRLPAML